MTQKFSADDRKNFLSSAELPQGQEIRKSQAK